MPVAGPGRYTAGGNLGDGGGASRTKIVVSEMLSSVMVPMYVEVGDEGAAVMISRGMSSVMLSSCAGAGTSYKSAILSDLRMN